MYSWYGNPDATFELSQRDPRQYPWGFYVEDINSGFLKWFESPKELLDFIVLEEPEIHMGIEEECEICPDVEEITKIRNNLQSVIGASETLNSTLLDDVNKILCNYDEKRIKWWGEFSKLCQGEEEYSRELIERFAGYCAFKIKTVTPEYEQKFIEYIHEWGG